MTREERDALGALPLPAGALYGLQTARALENLAFSRHRWAPIRPTSPASPG
ncbi:MAG: hypothetical protein U0802_08260 [Candidatus Binatia bacterium]